MQADLRVQLWPERLDEGTPEERATFGLLTMISNHIALTEGFDAYINARRPGPLVSAYYAAEWFAWNWWRLLHESRSGAADWLFVHNMSSIGEGYVWPNITIFSDGLRTALISAPSSRPDAKPFRFIGGTPSVMPSWVFEDALDIFIPSILERLHEEGVGETNLHRLWRDVLNERRDSDVARRRRLEAMLGQDTDSDSEAVVNQLIEDGRALGESAADELAAEYGQRSDGSAVITAEELSSIATTAGLRASLTDVVDLSDWLDRSLTSSTPAWRLGADIAHEIRRREHLGVFPISTIRLLEMAGISKRAPLEVSAAPLQFSYALDMASKESRVVLRSSWPTGRRFDIARLIADRILGGAERLHPATRSHTYRQKAQRSFAAELLSPFAVVDEMVANDFSEENLQDVAERFEVSTYTISSLLMNHGRIPRDVEFYAAAI